MKNRFKQIVAAILFLPTLGATASAAAYLPQAEFPVAMSSIRGLGSDAVGSLYVLGLPEGATTYSVYGFRTPGMEPLSAFETGVSTPTAFSVSGAGEIGILELVNQEGRLLRFTGSGAFLGESLFTPPPTNFSVFLISSAIDLERGRVYLGRASAGPVYCLQFLGSSCPIPENTGFVHEFDLQGTLLRSIQLPSTGSSCYRPNQLAVDADGSLYFADGQCSRIFKFDAQGNLSADWSSPRLWTAQAMWTGKHSDLYIIQDVCLPSGSCSPGVVRLSSSGDLESSVTVGASAGHAWDRRILYLASSDGGSIRRFILDEPPSLPVETAPLGPVAQHSASAALAWETSQDPDSDPIVYHVSLGTTPAALIEIGTTSAKSFATPPLDFGTTYYWRVNAQDSYLGLAMVSQPAPIVSFSMTLINAAPLPFKIREGTGTRFSRTASAFLSWEPAADPDRDTLIYTLYLSSNPTSLPPVYSGQSSSFTVEGVLFGTTYYWSVTAKDPFEEIALNTGGVQSFVRLFLDESPEIPELNALFMETPTLKTMQRGVEISWERVSNPQGDPISYTVFLGDSPQRIAPLVRIGSGSSLGAQAQGLKVLASGPRVLPVSLGDTVELRMDGLDFYSPYYLQIEAATPFGAVSRTPVQFFSLAPASGFPAAYNYPNPFNPNREGTNIVFNAPSSGFSRATVEVYSEMQDLLFKKEYANIPPGISEVRFDGRDRYGRTLFNGSYVCRVRFDGPEHEETFYLMVVK